MSAKEIEKITDKEIRDYAKIIKTMKLSYIASGEKDSNANDRVIEQLKKIQKG